eukprot:2189879-Pleurochrysis_carterae.AAC.1
MPRWGIWQARTILLGWVSDTAGGLYQGSKGGTIRKARGILSGIQVVHGARQAASYKGSPARLLRRGD